MAIPLKYFTTLGILLSMCEVSGAQVDGGWSAWSELSPLLCKCGEAQQRGVKIRRCDKPPPEEDGKQCPGDPYEVVDIGEACGTDSCQGDSGWSSWSEWTLVKECPVTCGGSLTIRLRDRKCNSLEVDCPGLPFQSATVFCSPDPCPVHGQWSPWSSLSIDPCPVTCGGGSVTETRSRLCNSPPPMHGGDMCPGSNQSVLSIRCGNDQCPVHGQWSQWSSTSDPCPVTCGGASVTETRSRLCDSPPPMHGGDMCPGSNQTVRSVLCGEDPCPVHGMWSPWSSWASGECPVTCGGMVVNVTRSRSCNNPPPLNGGDICPGLNESAQSILCGMDPCLVNGGWSSWSPWIIPPCPVSCGGADDTSVNRTRTRVCNNPTPQGAGAQCQGSDNIVERNPCGRQPCAGEWSSWGEWGTLRCDATCGGSVMGISTRSRTCSRPQGHTECIGDTEATRGLVCKLGDCPGRTTQWYEKLSEDTKRAIIGIVVAVGVFLLLLIIVLICLLCRKKKRIPAQPEPQPEPQPKSQPEPEPLTLKEGLTSGTASGSTFKDEQWHQSFNDTPQSS